MVYETVPSWVELVATIAGLIAGHEEIEVAVMSDGEMYLSNLGDGLTLQYISFPGVIPHPGGGGLAPYSRWVRSVHSSNRVALRECRNASALVNMWFRLDPEAKIICLIDGYVSLGLGAQGDEWNIYTKGFWRLAWDEIRWLEEIWGVEFPFKEDIRRFLKLRRQKFRGAVKAHLERGEETMNRRLEEQC